MAELELGNHLNFELLKSKVNKAVERATAAAAVRTADRLLETIKSILGHRGANKEHSPAGSPPYQHTGKLSSGMRVKRSNSGTTIELEIQSQQPYGYWLDQTRKNRPFSRKSVDELKMQLKPILKDIVKEALQIEME